MTLKNTVAAIVQATLVMFVLGCGGANTGAGTTTPPPTPKRTCAKWVDQGGGFFSGDKGRAFYGVGAASGMSNPAMVAHRRNHADMQARTNIAKTFKTHVTDLMKSYSRVIGRDNKASFEQFSQQVTKGFTDLDLKGTPVVDRCWEQSEQTQYSLAVMDIAAFKDTLKKMQGIPADAQKIVADHAEAAFEDLDKEIQKRKSK